MQRSAKKQQKGSKSLQASKQKSQKSMSKSRPMQGAASVAYATFQQGRAPKVVQGKDSIRVKHREFISTVTSSVAFAIANNIPLNPGLPASFPWLSQVAQAWEEYSFNSLEFEYVTRASTATVGSVILTPDYDASDSPPVNEQVACAYDGAQEDACWKDQSCCLPSQRLNAADKFRFVRNGPLSANQDIKLYDAGNMFVCTTEFAAASPVGKLWVEYDVTLKIPSLSPNGPAPHGGFVQGGGALTAANPMGNAPVPNALNRGITVDNTSVLRFSEAGDFAVNWNFQGTVLTAAAFTDGAGVTLLTGNTTINAAGTWLTAGRTYRVTNPATATIDVSLTATTVTVAFLNVGEAPPGSLA